MTDFRDFSVCPGRQAGRSDGSFPLWRRQGLATLKGNQGSLHNDVRLFLEDPARPAEAAHTTVGADHGRIETRTGSVCTDIGWAQELHAWPGLAAIGKMVRTREMQGKTTTETSYYLLSTPLSAQRFTEVVRAQWGIENALHWVLDVTMNEDSKRNWKDHGPENIGLLRRLALNLAKLEGSKGSTSLLVQFAKSHMR